MIRTNNYKEVTKIVGAEGLPKASKPMQYFLSDSVWQRVASMEDPLDREMFVKRMKPKMKTEGKAFLLSLFWGLHNFYLYGVGRWILYMVVCLTLFVFSPPLALFLVILWFIADFVKIKDTLIKYNDEVADGVINHILSTKEFLKNNMVEKDTPNA